MRKDLLHWLPAILYAGLIFFLSEQTPVVFSQTANILVHFVEFGLFALALVWGVTSGFLNQLTLKRAIWIWVVAAVYAASDEFHQAFVPSRVASVGDVAADTAGAVSSLLLVYLVKRGKWR